MHKYYIDKIMNSSDNIKLKKLQDLIIDTVTYMKSLDPEEYNNIECYLYEISEGKYLNEEKGKSIITKMKPFGMHWTFEQTEELRKSRNLSTIRPIDFWVVMNSAYNDFHNLFGEDIEMYIEYSKDFINDEDATEYKVYDYFTIIPLK